MQFTAVSLLMIGWDYVEYKEPTEVRVEARSVFTLNYYHKHEHEDHPHFDVASVVVDSLDEAVGVLRKYLGWSDKLTVEVTKVDIIDGKVLVPCIY